MAGTLADQLQDALGPAYAIARELGGGGMSRVFVARDRELDRDIVVKVLPEDAAASVSSDRFRREIALAAKLQHPHIVPLIAAGETADGLPFYTMPYIEGETLRDRLMREGELPVAEAIGILREVTRALGYAHERGVVHRDIKPDNVMLSGGAALVLDFGVAKAVSASVAAGAQATLTQMGVALGTPAYMAPEQAAADPTVDHRADIYALGCVAYEALTGSTPFAGRSTSAILAAHVMETPEAVQRRRSSISPALASLVMQCLEKRPADRPQSAAEVLRTLDAVAVSGPRAAGTSAAGAFSRPGSETVRRWAPWLIAAASLAVAIGIGMRPTSGEDDAPTVRFVIPGVVDPALNGAPAITPDGRAIVYAEQAEADHPLYVRPLADLRTRPLPGTEGAVAPFVSPDGQWVGFFTAANKLKTVRMDGSASARTLMDAASLSRGSWSASGVIVVDRQEDGGLAWLPAEGGAVRPLTKMDSAARENIHSAPLVLDDGRTVVFTIGQLADAQVAAVRLDPGARGPVPHARLGIVGAPVGEWRGWLLVRTGLGALSAVRFDAERLRLTGAPVAVLDDRHNSIDPIALARDGTLLSTPRLSSDSIVMLDDRGNSRALLGTLPLALGPWGRGYMTPRLSPDGRQLALMASSPRGFDVWTFDLESNTRRRITTGGMVYGSEWTPDGRDVIYSTFRGPTSATMGSVLMQPVDGSSPPREVFKAPGALWSSLTPDGRSLVIQRMVNQVWEIWLADVSGSKPAVPLVQEASNSYMPRLSPDGAWLTYVSSADDRDEVYVRPFPGPGTPTRVSDNGGTEPMWSPDGRRLFYRIGRDFMAASVAYSSGFSVQSRALLFRGQFDGGMPHANYAVTRDGKHFVFLAAGARSSRDAVVTLNWTNELAARLTKGK